jgi:hypothetical protein
MLKGVARPLFNTWVLLEMEQEEEEEKRQVRKALITYFVVS